VMLIIFYAGNSFLDEPTFVMLGYFNKLSA
jgi:hypothetical protein